METENEVALPAAAVQDLAKQLMEESDASKYKDLVELFNWNLSKKQLNRVAKLDELFDDITDQMVARFRHKPDQFSNDDLLNYMKTVQGAIDNTTKKLNDAVETPKIIQQTNTQINVSLNEASFDRDARERILAAVRATLAAASTPPDPEPIPEYEDKTEGEISNGES